MVERKEEEDDPITLFVILGMIVGGLPGAYYAAKLGMAGIQIGGYILQFPGPFGVAGALLGGCIGGGLFYCLKKFLRG